MMEDPIYRAAQFREIGLLWSVVPGIPTIFGSITDKAAICDDSSSSEHHFI
jgi:hypothetical protein